jgi:hypothetical protein
LLHYPGGRRGLSGDIPSAPDAGGGRFVAGKLVVKLTPG